MNLKKFIIVGMSFILIGTFSSCGVYKRDFDCPPGVGYPCTSVTDLEAIIEETDCGPDIFPRRNLQETCFICKIPQSHSKKHKSCELKQKIWVCSKPSSTGCKIESHFESFENIQEK